MKLNTNLNTLHIGSIIKEIALRKEILPQRIADLILCYQENAGKIYKINDMDCEAMVRVSYLMRYNFLKVISEKYLSHLPVIENNSEEERYYMELDEQSGRFKIIGDIGNKEVLLKIHIGHYIKAFADKYRLTQQNMAEELGCGQSYISYLYQQKSLKVKKLIQISNALKHNFIEEVYLDRMFIISSPNKVVRPIIIKTSQEVRIENPDDNNFVAIFRR